MRLPPKFTSAFTLIEMLVSIAILAILTVLIFLGVERARTQMGITKCMSNLRQVHTALMLYSQDHGGMLPGPLTSTMTPFFKMSAAGRPTSNQLSGYLAPYLNVPIPEPGQGEFNDYLACPAFLATLSASERRNPQIARSYGIPLGASGYPFGYTQSASPSKTKEPKNFHTYTIEFNPTETWLLRDIDGENTTSGNEVPPTPPHERGRNHLYADGSVRFLPK